MKELFEQAVRIVRKNGRELTGRNGADRIREKGRKDYVTEVDIRVQKQIFEELKKLDPGAGFLVKNRNIRKFRKRETSGFWIR